MRTLYKESGEVSEYGLVGVVGNFEKETLDGFWQEKERLLAKIREQFRLWNLPFIPSKFGMRTLELLLHTFAWRKQGKIYVPDEIHFNGFLRYYDFRRVAEFYGYELRAQ